MNSLQQYLNCTALEVWKDSCSLHSMKPWVSFWKPSCSLLVQSFHRPSLQRQRRRYCITKLEYLGNHNSFITHHSSSSTKVLNACYKWSIHYALYQETNQLMTITIMQSIHQVKENESKQQRPYADDRCTPFQSTDSTSYLTINNKQLQITCAFSASVLLGGLILPHLFR